MVTQHDTGQATLCCTQMRLLCTVRVGLIVLRLRCKWTLVTKLTCKHHRPDMDQAAGDGALFHAAYTKTPWPIVWPCVGGCGCRWYVCP